jgi:integrase
MICNVFKPKRNTDGKKSQQRMYRGRYRLDGDRKLTDVPLGTFDKQVAIERLKKLVREKQQEREGMISPKPKREAARKPLAEHLEDFILSRQSIGRDGKYVKELRAKVVILIEECGWSLPGQVTAESFESWRNHQDRSAKTLNEYLGAISGLMNWLERRIGPNPVRFVEKARVSGTQQRDRRAFTMDEIRRLVVVSGERGVVYLTAAFTGLRRGELGQLTWSDVHLDAAKPFINVRAAISKNHKQCSLPLTPAVVERLQQHRSADAVPSDRVFRRLIPRMDRFRKDLEAAEIPYVDENGEFADFHALRNTFATMLTLAGVSQRVIMELMRHSDMRLTAKVYTDAGMLPTGDAVMKLPALNVGGESHSQIDSQKLVTGGLLLSHPVQVLETANCSQTLINRGFEADLSHAVPACPKAEMVLHRSRSANLLYHSRSVVHPSPHPSPRWGLSLPSQNPCSQRITTLPVTSYIPDFGRFVAWPHG